MKKISIFLLILLLLFITSCKNSQPFNVVINTDYYELSDSEKEKIDSLNISLDTISKMVANSSVIIKVRHSTSLINKESTASGVIVKKSNNKYYVLTCRHVIFNGTSTLCDDIKVGLHPDYFISSKVVYYDDNVDIALLSFELDKNLIPTSIGTLSEDSLGNFIICCSTPISSEYYHTITIGNISSLDRTLVEKNINNEEVTNHYFSHTATTNNGSSGGGLFNLKGELIGICDWKLNNAENMNFGISINIIKEILKDYL